MTNYTERNNQAMDKVAKVIGFENPITIWFCDEVENNPTMNDALLGRLMKTAFLMVMSLNNDEEEDEE